VKTKEKRPPELDFASLYERIMAAVDQPIESIEFSDEELTFDFDAPVAPPVSVAAPIFAGTRPVSIRVPGRVIHAFKVQAAKSGCGYQTLMNRALRRAAEGYL
jgi:uncharacterized protein (DUF4415 family)